MTQRNHPSASQLRKLIRKIVREELSQFFAESKKENNSASLPEQREDGPTIKPPRMAEDPHTGTWAIFGTPELAPVQTRSEHPRALPGFPELYRPTSPGLTLPRSSRNIPGKSRATCPLKQHRKKEKHNAPALLQGFYLFYRSFPPHVHI